MQLTSFAIQLMFLGQTTCVMEKDYSCLSGEDRVGSGFAFGRSVHVGSGFPCGSLAVWWSRLCQQCERSAPLQKHCQIFLGMVLIMWRVPLMPEILHSVVFAVGQPVLPLSPFASRLQLMDKTQIFIFRPSPPDSFMRALWLDCTHLPADVEEGLF